MSTRFARETGRNWSRFVPHHRLPDLLVTLAGLRRSPTWSASHHNHYLPLRAACFRPVRLPGRAA